MYLDNPYTKVETPAKPYRAPTRRSVVTRGGGRSGLVRNSGYVTTGGRSFASADLDWEVVGED